MTHDNGGVSDEGYRTVYEGSEVGNLLKYSIAILLAVGCITTACYSADKHISSIEHYRISNSLDCNEGRRISAYLKDYALYGYNGKECISTESELSISGDMIEGITLSKNKYSDPALNAIDVRITLSKDIDQSDGGPEAFAAFIDDYFLGNYRMHEGRGRKVYLMVVNEDTKRLVESLNRLNSDVKAVWAE